MTWGKAAAHESKVVVRALYDAEVYARKRTMSHRTHHSSCVATHLEHPWTAKYIQAKAGVAHRQTPQLQVAGVFHQLLENHRHIHTCATLRHQARAVEWRGYV
jgi:hypothetical protein